MTPIAEPDPVPHLARYVPRLLGLAIAGSLLLPPAALAVAGDPPSRAAEHAVRWGLPIGLGAVFMVLLLGLVFKARISTLVVGADHRISTSKTIAAVWTLVVAAALIGLVYAKLLNHPQALDRTGAAGVIGQYAVLFGGPLGAAILAKQIVTSQVTQNPGIKTVGKPTLKDLIADDAGDTDLGDFQYVLFNLVALFYVISTLLHTPLNGLPHIPDVLLGLTSVSAVGYVGKKAVTPIAGAATPAPAPAPHLAGAPARMWRPGPTGGFARASGATNALAPTRMPGSLPDPSKPAGTPNPAMPFDHIVVVMMENHSFDNLLGKLSLAGQPLADGLDFDANGNPTNSNPNAAGQPVKAFPFPSTGQGQDVRQNWNATHQQVNGGLMDGFLKGASADHQPMGFYPPEQLPFAYSLAKTFTVANRWFSSAPCPTYPNRRFLLAGTAYGGTTTSVNTLTDGPPPNGTIFDRLSDHGISWRNYFTDVPMTAVIPSILEKYLWSHVKLLDDFFSDCNAGTLPAVSFVDPDIGLLSDLGSVVDQLPLLPTFLNLLGVNLRQMGSSQEDPQDMNFGEKWAHRVISAVLRSPAWSRTLLIYTYDEHGGYYDHVPPPPAIAPDMIPPSLGPNDVPGGYDVYGPRVPAVVVSPYSRMNSVTDVVHDHTSVLATIEAKWNLPALTYRDANAATVMDFLDVNQAPNLSPPNLSPPKAAP
jgi:phospholipase C